MQILQPTQSPEVDVPLMRPLDRKTNLNMMRANSERRIEKTCDRNACLGSAKGDDDEMMTMGTPIGSKEITADIEK